MQLPWIRRRSEEIGSLESESLLSSDIELAELIRKVGGRLLLAVCRLLRIVSTLRLLLLLLLLLKLVIPSKARSKELRRWAGWIHGCSRIWTTVISLRLPRGVLPTFRVLRLGQVVDWHRWTELGWFPLRVARCGFWSGIRFPKAVSTPNERTNEEISLMSLVPGNVYISKPRASRDIRVIFTSPHSNPVVAALLAWPYRL